MDERSKLPRIIERWGRREKKGIYYDKENQN